MTEKILLQCVCLVSTPFFSSTASKEFVGGFIKERMGKMPISILANVEKFHELKFCNTRSPNTTAYLYKSRRSWIFQDLWHSGLRYEKKAKKGKLIAYFFVIFIPLWPLLKCVCRSWYYAKEDLGDTKPYIKLRWSYQVKKLWNGTMDQFTGHFSTT